MKRRRAVITGLGVIAPNGIGKDAFWANLIAGHSAVDYISAFDPTPYPCKVAAEIRDFHPTDFMPKARAKTMARFSQLAIASAAIATEDAGLRPPDLLSAALCHGTAAHGLADLGEDAHRRFLSHGWKILDGFVGLEYSGHAATAHVQGALKIGGPVVTLASACCTGIDALAWAADQIRSDQARVAIAGASEAPLSPFLLSLFAAGGYLSTWQGPPAAASRPYDLLRSGFVPAEASASLVLEDLDSALHRGATIYAEVLSHASASESAQPSHDDGYSAALTRAIRLALDRAGLRAGDLDYICAHGNSIKLEDRAEATAHRNALGSHAYRVPVSSIKSMVGQPFAAAGVLQAVAAALAVHSGLIPPTINHEIPDPDCDLDYVPNHSRFVRIRHALLHSHSLGGHLPGTHSSMILSAHRPV